MGTNLYDLPPSKRKASVKRNVKNVNSTVFCGLAA